jgi:hypothetical protein
MAWMGHDSERAAIIYQHEARGADLAITSASTHIATTKAGQDDDSGDSSGEQHRPANGPRMARGDQQDPDETGREAGA